MSQLFDRNLGAMLRRCENFAGLLRWTASPGRAMLACMRPGAPLTPVFLAILACGGTKGDTDGSTGSASTSSAGTTTEGPTTGGSTAIATSSVETTSTTAPGTSGPGTTGTTEASTAGTTEAGATTTSADASSSGTSGTGEGSSTGGQGNVEYAAFFVPGGLDRIVVRKADHDAERCTSVVFVWPMPNIMPDLFIPEMWAFQDAEIAQGTAGCLAFMGPLPNAVAAADITGTVDWQTPMPCAGTLDIDASLVFPPGPPWVPAHDVLNAAALPLQGC